MYFIRNNYSSILFQQTKKPTGRGQCCTITFLHMNRLNKTESAILVALMCSLLPENLHSELILFSNETVS